MPPRELPGLYFDEQRGKYFPLASKPRPPPHTTLQPVMPADDAQRVPSVPTHRVHRNLQLSQRPDRSNVVHTLTAGAWARTSQVDATALSTQSSSQATVFASIPNDEGLTFAVGSADGAIHFSNPKEGARRSWTPAYYMQSGVSAVCSTDTTWIATSFGSPCEVYFAETTIESALRTVCLSLSPHYVQDVRDATFDGRTVVLGGHHNLVIVDANVGVHSKLPVGSDVLSLSPYSPAYPDEVICGARNGSVKLFDVRLPANQHAPDLLHGHLAALKTSAARVRRVRDWMLIVASLDGHLEVHDLRFLRRDMGARSHPAAMVLRGHVNSYALNLPLETDPSEDFLFAAGQDRRVRMWSLRTGDSVVSSAENNAFNKTFESPIIGLHADRNKNGLYVVCENRIEYFA